MKRAAVIKDSKLQEVDDKEVDVELPSATRLVGTHANVVPMYSNAQSPRLFYAARFVNQAMPVVNREAPLVQSLDPESAEGLSFEQEYGKRVGASFWDQDGDAEVVEVTPDSITLKDRTGKKVKKDIYNNFQFNRKTYITSKPRVQVGDKVKKGQILASSNFTDDNGTMSFGRNARIAVVPYKGYSMDDAIVVSESFADKMRSMHNYAHELQKDTETKFGKVHYTSVFPQSFTKDQLENLDDNGVAKPGTVLKKGDPIMLATRPKPVYSNMEHLGKLGKTFKAMRSDAAEVWEHDYPGVVVDAVDSKKARKVFVTAEAPLKVGDKITIRNGQKCYSEDTEIFTTRGWVRFPDLLDTDQVAALFDRNAGKSAKMFGVKRSELIPQKLYAEFVSPTAYAVSDFEGELFGFENQDVSYLVTGNHRVWRKYYNVKGGFKCVTAERAHNNTRAVFMNTASFELPYRHDPSIKSIPLIDITRDEESVYKVENNKVDFIHDDFVKFIALYLCKGACNDNGTIVISRSGRPIVQETEYLLDRLGLSWKIKEGQTIIQPNKSLEVYLRGLDTDKGRRVPEWVFQSSIHSLTVFKYWMLQCLNHRSKQAAFYASNPMMRDAIGRIFTLLGIQHTNGVARSRTKDISAQSTVRNGFFKQAYAGKVYCVQVPGLGVVLTRRNGKQIWCGNSIISSIMPDDQILQDSQGRPFEILLNPLSMPSRVNTATLYELAVGKVAAKQGKPIAMPAYTKPGESRLDVVKKMLADAGESDTEEVFDPVLNRKLERPITTGVAYVNKLHHVVESKLSARGNSAYSADEQPLRGGSDSAQAKKLGGLETVALLARGGYANLREASTLRGQKSDAYWAAIRQGYKPAEPGKPFVFDKFRAMLNGAGMDAKDMKNGVLRLSPMTDKDLDARDPLEVKNGKLVDPETMDGEDGGLFDQKMVALGKWGKITLPTALPNPAFEKQIAALLGIKIADMRRVLAGEIDLDEVRNKK